MQPDLPEPRQEPGRSPFDDLRERLARLPASHPSAPGYRDWPDEPTEPGAVAGDGLPDDAGEPDGTGDDSEPDRNGPDGPDTGRGAASQRPGRGGWAGGTAVGYLPVDGGDGPYRPWFAGEPSQPWFSDDPPGRSG